MNNKTLLSVDDDMMEQLQEYKGFRIKQRRHGVSEFIREAIAEKLERESLVQERLERVEREWNARRESE